MPDATPSNLFTSESVTEGHPDKLCDAIADALLDDVLAHDTDARCRDRGGDDDGARARPRRAHARATGSTCRRSSGARSARSGTSTARIGFDWETCGTLTAIKEQSPDIAMGVDHALESREGVERDELGAGDQGMMFGYATDESDS